MRGKLGNNWRPSAHAECDFARAYPDYSYSEGFAQSRSLSAQDHERLRIATHMLRIAAENCDDMINFLASRVDPLAVRSLG